MDLKAKAPFWLGPLLGLAIAGAALPATVSGLLLMKDVRPGTFCDQSLQISIDRALHDARVRRLHTLANWVVVAGVGVAIAFGAAAGQRSSQSRRRWATFVLSAAALVGYLAADLSGQKEPWHVLSPGISGWTKIPLQELMKGAPPGAEGGISFTHPECDPAVRESLRRRVTFGYWLHVVTGLAMAAAAVGIGAIGFGWRPARSTG